jgi:hypothetical protein
MDRNLRAMNWIGSDFLNFQACILLIIEIVYYAVYYAVSFAVIIQLQINGTFTTNREVRKALEMIMISFLRLSP